MSTPWIRSAENSEPFTTRPKLRELNDRNVNIVNDPSQDFVERVIEQFAEAPFTIYAMYDDESMFAAELTPEGLVTMYGHSTVCAPSLPNEMLSVPIGGQNGDFNRRFVLPHAAAISPVREFLLHHRTPPELGWQRSRSDRPEYELWPEDDVSRRIDLNAADLRALFAAFAPNDEIEVVRSRPHNRTIPGRTESVKLSVLANELEEALFTDHLAGGDIEIPLPDGRTIQGSHDGRFRLTDVDDSKSD